MLIVDLIQDHRYIVLAVTTPLLLIYGSVLYRALTASPTSKRPVTGPLRRSLPKPPVKPPQGEPGKQESIPAPIDPGVAGHQRAGSAKTVKLPVTPTKPADHATPAPSDVASPPADRIEVKTGPGHDTTAIKLSSQDDTKTQAAPGIEGGRSTDSKTGLLRKASRMEELGFHVGVHPEDSSAPAGDAPVKTAELPRSQTAELTSILERIDKFLADDQPAAATDKPKMSEPPAMTTAAPPVSAPVATPAPSQPAAPAETPATKKTQPIWARADALDDDVEHPPSAAPTTTVDKAPEKPAERPTEKPADGDQQRLF